MTPNDISFTPERNKSSSKIMYPNQRLNRNHVVAESVNPIPRIHELILRMRSFWSESDPQNRSGVNNTSLALTPKQRMASLTSASNYRFLAFQIRI
ncbi:hypothetical protein AVEN_227827-1 [Araneus ventricosus]|uniref:Uncharacterized protein n=1 Tax=Araneus ventricosus TaxID=182803 RepID=A0A4Y2NQR9_ARAVE|nr:hypothetical protein AVEN_227827-1 [Araneus ventricosus]